jgi:glucose-6-phosphate 1-epimerase
MKSETRVEELRANHGIDGVADILAGNGGLPKVVVDIASCSGEIYLHGAHVTSWIPAGDEETIFVSKEALWQDGRAIRGGIPICFPWFRNRSDNPSAPQHGFVRTRSWQLDSIRANADAVTVEMSTLSDADSRVWWPGDFRLAYRATFGKNLELELQIENTGPSSLQLEEALHTYHRVGNAGDMRIDGLDGVAYLDNTDSNRRCLQHGPVQFASQLDRVYLDTDHSLRLIDSQMHRQVNVTKKNSLTTVVWNPWKEGARSMIDMGDEEWTQMVCIEASNIRDFTISLQPGQQHTMRVTITVDQL